MKRIVGALLACFMLAGCTRYTEIDLQNELVKRMENAVSAKIASPSNHKKLYSYYLDPSIGRLDSYQSGNLLNYEGVPFAMNLNVSSLINRKYYSGTDTESSGISRDHLAAEMTGTYEDREGKEHMFEVSIYDAGNGYLTYLKTDTVEFCGVAYALASVNLAGVMLKTARSVTVDEDTVIAAYSNKETVIFNGEKIQLFKSVAPENGRVEELFEDSNILDDNTADEASDQGVKQITSDDVDDN